LQFDIGVFAQTSTLALLVKEPETDFSYGGAVLRGRSKRAKVELLSNL
jgi:hypothetical protein